MKTEFVRARVHPSLKTEVHALFDALGLSPSQAINVFYKMVQRERGLPFDMHVPNTETAKAIREARAKKGITICKNEKDLFDQLGL